MKYWWVIAVATLVGCGSGEDEDRVAAISALTGDVNSGAELYDFHCNRCHGAGGVGTPDGADIRSATKDTAISAMLAGPETMPFFDGLSDQELADLAAQVEQF